MAEFKKGQPRHPNAGRKKGTPNKKHVPKIAEYLVEKKINPIQEILDLMPDLRPYEQVAAWMDLLSYCEAKPKAEGAKGNDDQDLLEEFEDVPNATLIQLLKSKPENVV